MTTAHVPNLVRGGALAAPLVLALLLLVATRPPSALASSAPSFGSTSHEFSVNENTPEGTVVGTVDATDPDGDALTYSVSGSDAAKFNEVFTLDAGTGEIAVKAGATINYESSSQRTSYRISVSVTDGEDDSGAAETEPTTDATASVHIRINNVDEPGSVTISTDWPQVGQQLSVSFSDPDGRKGGIYVSWWERAHNPEGPFAYDNSTLVQNNRKLTYTPTDGDKYMYIRWNVKYFDAACLNRHVSTIDRVTNRCLRTVSQVSANPVSDEEGLIILSQTTNTPATGHCQVRRWSALGVGTIMWGGARNLADADGIQGLYNITAGGVFHFKWYRIDPITGQEKRVTHYIDGNHLNNVSFPWKYKVKKADLGKNIQCRVSFRDDRGNWETVRSDLIYIPPPKNTEASGVPVITGSAEVGETLSVDLSGISDPDGIVASTYSYEWYANDENGKVLIAGATESTYTLTVGDEGKRIKVKVSFTDEFGYAEALTSESTGTVASAGNSNRSHDSKNRGGLPGTVDSNKGPPASRAR